MEKTEEKVQIENSLHIDVQKIILAEMKKLPDQLLLNLHKTLKKVKKSTFIGMDASFYSPDTQEIYINTPFNLPIEVFLAMDKNHEMQLKLMNLGGYSGMIVMVNKGIEKLNAVDSEALKKIILDFSIRFKKYKNVKKYLQNNILDKEDFDGFLDKLKVGELPKLNSAIDFPEYDYMGGGNKINRKEILLPWIIRHEVGHAVDELFKWNKSAVPGYSEFGGWIYYDSYEIMLKTGLKDYNPDKYPMKLFVFQFINNDGCKIQKDGRSFMLDGYGRWCSYLTDSRKKAVSNYQYSSARDWFAEAFAAYYGPNHEEAEKALGPVVCKYFDDQVALLKP